MRFVTVSSFIAKRCLVAALVAASLTSCRKPSADEHLRKADDYVGQSRLQEAVVEYRSAIQADPKRGDIRLKLGDLYMRLGDAGGAFREYVRAADLLPRDAAAQLKAGNLLLMAGQSEDAKTRANAALALDPKNVDAEILLGNALAGLKDLDGAIAQYQEALALDPNKDKAYANIGIIQFVRGQRAEAEATFRKAIEVAPKSVPARMGLANFLWATGRTSEAEQTFKDALALDPFNLAANRALGTFYIASNRAGEAEPFFKTIAQTANTTTATIGLADYYVFARRFDDARKVLKGLAAKEPAYAAATTRLAAVDALEGNRAQALAKLKDVLDKYPKDMPARLLRARLLLIDDKRDDALAQANSIVNEDPNSPVAGDAYLLIGRIQTMLDRRADAIKSYEEALKRQPQPLSADVALAALYLAGGSVDKAATYTQQALAIQPKNPVTRSLLVRVLLAQNNLTRAREELALLQKEFPNSPTVLDLVAAQQFGDHQGEAARASYARAAALDPNDLEALSGLVALDLTTGHAKDAVDRVEATLKRVKPTPDFLILAGRTYFAAGNAAKAEELLKQAIDADPARLRAYALLGELYIREKRLDDAKDRFEQMAARDPKSVSANTMLGMLLEGQHNIAEAEKQYQKVLAVDPRAAVAANNLAWIYVASNRNLDQALQLAQTSHQVLPDEPHVNDTLGWIYYQKNMAPQAIQYLEMSVQKDASDPTVFYHLGKAYVQAGDLDKARQVLKRALSMQTNFDGAADARKTLAQLGG